MNSCISNGLECRDNLSDESPYAEFNREIITCEGTNGLVLPFPQPPQPSQQSSPKETTLHTRLLEDTSGFHEHRIQAIKSQGKLQSQDPTLRNAKLGYKVESLLNRMSNWTRIKKKSEADTPRSLAESYGKRGHVIGYGAFGTVRIACKLDAEDPTRTRLFAVKEFKQRSRDSLIEHKKRVISEYSISSSMYHPHVVTTLDLLQSTKGASCQVMEYCSGGDLYSFVLSVGQLEMVEANCFFKQLLQGVEYLHEMGVAHRDLKLENILLTQRGKVKIADFGNAECFRMAWETEVHMISGVCGSRPYIAPEEYVDKQFDGRAVDIWACGMIYMSMRTGYHIWQTSQKGRDKAFEQYVQDRKKETGYKPIEQLETIECRNVVYSALDPTPARRLTAQQILLSEWVRKIEVCDAGNEGLDVC
ncbi:unnamed protein product [Periconia digitata]|uniref:non-specific serine/threonine protein kinase n=1 Tax=Periconia digitata TaxID=1303443 RepID=A0A9W4UE01_9PLEO|nr:unnamed protein product [Periconia digitata]